MPRLAAAHSKKRRRWLLIPLALVAVPPGLRLLGVEATNRASTSLGSADASLRTRFYAPSPLDVRAQVLEAVGKLSTYGRAWRVVKGSLGESGPSQVRCEVPILVFTDDLVVTIEPHEEGSRVDVSSASRVGKGDFGENARHIRQLLGALDARLPTA